MEVVGFGDSRLRREVSFLALVSSTPTRVPHTQPSSHFPPHSEPGELVAQARLTPPCSAFLTAPRHHSRGCAAKAAGNSGCGAGRIPTLPAPRAPSSGPLVPDPRECGALFPSHLLPVHLSVRDGEGRRRRDASQPPPLGAGGRASGVGARRRQPLLPFAPALRICPCSRRSCCRRLGCLGGRLRVT